MILQTTLGTGLVLAQQGGDSVHLLNASAAELWQLYQVSDDEVEARPLIQKLRVDYGLSKETASSQVEMLLLHWQQNGLVKASLEQPDTFFSHSCDWVVVPAFPKTAQSMTLTVKLAGLCFGLIIENAQLTQRLTVLLSSVRVVDSECLAHHLVLTGDVIQWQLSVNVQPETTGQGLENALTCVLHTLIDLACQAEERLLVVHGAGLRLTDNRGLLLIAPGGSGKTTLATALNAQGYGLLSDDVVPVTMTGELLGLGTPICLKSGSWPILMPYRADLTNTQSLERYGQTVRYLPPLGNGHDGSIRLGLLLFPRYQPGNVPHCKALSPEEAFQYIIEAEAVIRNLTQAKLDALANWVSSVPAYALSYPDLDSALALVQQQVDHRSPTEIEL
ncbi:MAG: PqqD family peptide modification chaperone [Methylococcales bacterium]